MYHTSFLQQNGQLLVYGMGVDRCPCESDEWGESELKPGGPERFRTFSFLQSTSRCTYAVEEITHEIFVLDHDKDQKDGNLQLEPLEGGSMIDVLKPESPTDWPPGRYVFDPQVWESSRPQGDYELVERFEEGPRRDDVADINIFVRETEKQEETIAEDNHGDSDGCTSEAQDTAEHDTIIDSGFGGFHDDRNENDDFLDCGSSIDDAYSDDDSFVTCDQDFVSISCDGSHDVPGVGWTQIKEQDDMSMNHADSVETSPKHSQSTKDKERAATDTDTTATELHKTVPLSSDAATHSIAATNSTGQGALDLADTAQVGVSVKDEPASHDEHPVPTEDGITDLSATLDAIAVTNDHDFPARETFEDVSGEAVVGQENHQRPPRIWRRLCPGQDTLFIIEQDEPMRKDVHISITPRREIYTLSAERLQSLSDMEEDVNGEVALFKYTSMVFASPACLNASFRQTGPNEVDGLNIDLKAARRAFEVISKNDKLLEKLSNVISVDLCNSVPQLTPHVEALRFIFVLMECPVFSNPHRPWGRRALAAAESLMGFLHQSSQAGDNKSNSATPARWWKFEPMSFRRTITAYRLSLTILINDRALLDKELDNFQTYLRVLSSLNQVNLQHDILSIKTFYVKNLDIVSFQPLLSELFGMNCVPPPRPLRKFSWTSYPFLIDLELKTVMFKHQNIDEQEDAMEQERNLDPTFDILPFFGFPPRVSLHLEVNREDVFGSSVRKQLAEMLCLPRYMLQKPLKVHFMDEMGIDEGALSMDFFRLVFEELLDPETNDLFRYVNELDKTHSPVWFRKDCEDSELAEICGLLFGFSLYNKAIVPLPFPQLLYAKLLGKGPNSDMEEAAELDKEFTDQMSKLRTGTEDDVIGSCYGDEVKLEDGRSVEVTTENVDLYVDNMVREYLVPSQFAAFQQGFNRVFNPAAFALFRPIELEALVMGEKHFDWKALEQSTQYIQPYTDSHPTIKMFWKVLHALDNDMKRKFLVFVAGSDRIPVGGLRNLGLHIDHLHVPMDDFVDEQPYDTEDRLTRLLPVGHGCDNHGYRRTLRLPMYTSVELMEDRLTVALSYYDCPFHIA
eukprot:XP_011669897.1 PREDICTED: probable E3 ubiquitin-protein ligase HERC4 [Strongylocentrotus purpuratus]